jgi:hypothetical protein
VLTFPEIKDIVYCYLNQVAEPVMRRIRTLPFGKVLGFDWRRAASQRAAHLAPSQKVAQKRS